eukprot:366490-Chlamydomonas_euryale.AAC.47
MALLPAPPQPRACVTFTRIRRGHARAPSSRTCVAVSHMRRSPAHASRQRACVAVPHMRRGHAHASWSHSCVVVVRMSSYRQAVRYGCQALPLDRPCGLHPQPPRPRWCEHSVAYLIPLSPSAQATPSRLVLSHIHPPHPNSAPTSLLRPTTNTCTRATSSVTHRRWAAQSAQPLEGPCRRSCGACAGCGASRSRARTHPAPGA